MHVLASFIFGLPTDTSATFDATVALAQAAALLRGTVPPPDPTLDEQRELVHHHFDLVCRRFGVERDTLLMRKFACSYAQGLPGARDFRGKVSRVVTREEFLEVMRTTFPRHPPVPV
mgnify:CR=1 FL=1